MQCPVCEETYAHTVLHSWNFMMSGGEGPPPPSGTCPHCLHYWEGKPTKLNKESLKRQATGLGELKTQFHPKDRQRLLAEHALEDFQLDDYLKAHARWVATGSPADKIRRWNFSKKPSGWDSKLREERKKALKLVQRMKSGPENGVVLKKDLKRITMGYIEDWLQLGDDEMESFTITWLLWTVDRDLSDSDYCLTSIARHLMKISAEDWPGVPDSPGTQKVMLESLQYLRGKRAWGVDFDRAIGDLKQPGLAQWLLACAAARSDRSPLPVIWKYTRSTNYWQLSGILSDYFQACGRKGDLGGIENLHRIWLAREKRRKTSWEVSTSVLGDIEATMRILRVRLILQVR